MATSTRVNGMYSKIRSGCHLAKHTGFCTALPPLMHPHCKSTSIKRSGEAILLIIPTANATWTLGLPQTCLPFSAFTAYPITRLLPLYPLVALPLLRQN